MTLIRSMTGFGDASGTHEGSLYSVEVRSVNNKYLKTTVRVPERLQTLEPELEQKIRARISRGSVVITISCSEQNEKAAYTVNQPALRSYADQVAQAKGCAVDDINIEQLMNLPGVLQSPGDEENRLEKSRKALEPLVGVALDHLVAMRTREGMALKSDLALHLDFIGERLKKIEEIAPRVAVDFENRLKSRMVALMSEFDVQADQVEIVREVAVYAEKTDIAEEIARLGEHIVHFGELLENEDDRPIGRTMDFLSQELLREANTIASKSPDAAMSRLIVEIKGAIDRIKEQVQNAE
ncbi:MAG: YicC/YloC family endoribonuclease [Phycisphaerales bacterium]